MSLFSVEGKSTVITGGGGVLGGSVANHFAQQGAKVIILDRSQDAIDKKIQELKDLGGQARGYVCDVLKPEVIKEVRSQIVKEVGGIDILINAAGGNVPGATQAENQSVFELKIDDMDTAMDLNMKGTIYPSLILGEELAKSDFGTIINISSMTTYSAISRVMSYSVAKSGVNAFTKWMACEMADKYEGKIRVNALAPGFFIGEQNRKLLLNEDGSLTDRSKKVINKTPMRRFGQIDELNGAVQFLCSDAARFITGIVLPIDGGFSSFSGV